MPTVNAAAELAINAIGFTTSARHLWLANRLKYIVGTRKGRKTLWVGLDVDTGGCWQYDEKTGEIKYRG